MRISEKPTFRAQRAPMSLFTQLRSFVTDAILIAVVSVFGYKLAYSFEIGFARQFGYPRYLIELSTSNIAYSLTIAGLIVIFMIQVYWFYRTTEVGRAPRALWTLSGFAVITAGIQLSLSSRWEWGSFMMQAVMLGWFGIRVYRRRFHPDTHGPETRPMMIGILAIIVMINCYFSARALGSWQARTQQNFYALRLDPTMLVIRMYGSNLIAVRYDAKLKRFTNEIRVFRVQDDVSLDLQRVLITARDHRRVSVLGTAYD